MLSRISRLLLPLLASLLIGQAHAGLDAISNADAGSGVREALAKGAEFAVASLGGMTSAWGVMIAGLLFGATEALITALLGSGYTQILTFALVIAALALMPNGLFGRADVKKV